MPAHRLYGIEVTGPVPRKVDRMPARLITRVDDDHGPSLPGEHPAPPPTL
ncbi:hypothetical protein [Streptomyces sp. NPDC040750]